MEIFIHILEQFTLKDIENENLNKNLFLGSFILHFPRLDAGKFER